MPALNDEQSAIGALVSEIGNGYAFGQLWIERLLDGYLLRHVNDRDISLTALKPVRVEELREWSRFNYAGAFRPLKGAPDLRAGWSCQTKDVQELEQAILHLYPGGVADWYYVRTVPEPAVSLRDYLERQTGMYRVTKALEGARAVAVVKACCGETRCLKRRLWAVEGMPSDSSPPKSVVPCLEPCAVLLDFARREARMLREAPVGIQLSPMDLDTISSVLEHAAAGRLEGAAVRSGDTGEPLNPRRILLALEHLRMQVGDRLSASGGPVE